MINFCIYCGKPSHNLKCLECFWVDYKAWKDLDKRAEMTQKQLEESNLES